MAPIEGRLKLDTWESDGQKRSKLKVVGERLQMLGGNRKKKASESAENGDPVTAGAPNDDEDIPF